MTANLSFIQLVIEASLVVQLVLVLLLLTSIASWAIIIRKRRLLHDALRDSDAFELSFWSGGDLTSIYADITKRGETPADMAGIFEAGFREFRRLKAEDGLGAAEILDGARRAMRVAQLREMDRLEHNWRCWQP